MKGSSIIITDRQICLITQSNTVNLINIFFIRNSNKEKYIYFYAIKIYVIYNKEMLMFIALNLYK